MFLCDSEEFHHNPAFIRALLDSMGEGLLLLDPEYRILNTNKRFLEIHHAECDQVVGHHCYEVSHGSAVPCWQSGDSEHLCPVKKAFATGRAASEVHTHYDRDRGEHYVEVRAYPIRDEEGKISQVIETHSDITEQVQLELRLRQAEKMESIGTMAGGIAHDLNNILTPIVGYSDLELLRVPQTDPCHESLSEINRAAVRAVELVQQILAFARRQLIRRETLDLNEVIGEIYKLLDRVIREDVELEVLSDEGLSPILADRTQMEQVIVNLAVNGRDAMPRGGRLSIETGNICLDDHPCQTCGGRISGDYVLLQVTDSGEGIAPENMDRIFEPFFTTKEPGQGTGMGLSTIVGIMHQHGGHDNVYSEVGHGSTFKVYLPAAGVEAVKVERAALKDDKEIKTGAGETILVVDDNSPVRQILERMLTISGYQVVLAQNGREALDLFTSADREIDLVISDVIMPGMNGRELMERIETLRPGTPFIMMSGYTENVVHREYELDPGVEFLQKPATMDETLAAVRRLLDRRG